MKKLISLFIIFVTFLGVTLGKTIYVNANYPVNGDGTSWSSPYTNLQDAVTFTVAGDLVLVTNGVYSPITTGNKAITIQSVEGSSATSIDGGGTTRCATLGTGVVLKGFTVFNGYTTGNGGGVISGSIYDSVVSNNLAATNGGGISGASVASNCVIRGNTAATYGGGSHGSTLTGCTISGNTADRGGGSAYGTLTGCTISGNTANQYGGGSYQGTLIDCVISGNTANQNGGGSYNSTLTDCVISNNVATLYEGGGSYNSTLTGCTISGNTAASYGGGSRGGTLTGCTISGNTAGRGGGTCYSVVYNSAIYNNTATAASGALSRGKYYNCTIYGNTAPDYAAGSADGSASEPSIYNCVIYGNVNTGPNARQLGVPPGGIFYCSSIDSVDKLYYGVNTPTVFPVYGDPQFTDPANNDFTLLPTSPCVNKGANQYVTTATDLLGSPRIKDWRVDMGAYESQSTRFVTTPNALFPMGTKDVYRWTPLELRPIAWYKGDGNALDAMGNYDGTWYGAAAYTNCAVGNGFKFLGSTMVSSSFTPNASTFSAAFWFKGTIAGGSTYKRLFCVRNGNFWLHVLGSNVNNTLQAAVVTGGNLSFLASSKSAGVIDTTSFRHVIVTWGDGALTLYLDGIEQTGAFLGTMAAGGDNVLSIGARSDNVEVTGYDGTIDDLLVWNRTLTQTEITKLYTESVKKAGAAW
jgi:parallel beta-helix repeat protein